MFMQLEINTQSLDLLVQQIADNVYLRIQDKINQAPIEKEPSTTKVLTRKETAKRLNVSLTTLNTWSRRGIIQSKKVGSRVRYLESDVLAALQNVSNLKTSY